MEKQKAIGLLRAHRVMLVVIGQNQIHLAVNPWPAQEVLTRQLNIIIGDATRNA